MHPDWKTNSKTVGFWQRLALRTNGTVTPGNFLSVAGLVLVVWGAWLLGLDEHWALGIVLVVCGRFFDVLDGYAAEMTHTKSRLGGAVDVICDKLAMIAIVLAAIYGHLAWSWFLVALVLCNGYLMYFGVRWGRVYHIYPSGYAKAATFTSWLAILLSVLHAKEAGVWYAIGEIVTIGAWTALSALGLRAYHRQLRNAFQKQQRDSEWAKEVTALVCVVNKHATHFHQAHALFVSLAKTLGKVPVEIDIVGHEQRLEKFFAAHQPGEKILVTIAGGDGTVSAVTNTLIRLQAQSEAMGCILLPLWGGNANDFAYMLNGFRIFARPGRLLSHAIPMIVPLIKLELKESAKPTRTVYASCYASFGATAYAARQLEARRFSTRKLLYWLPPLLIGREVVAVVKALLSTPQYTGEIDDKQQAFYEHSLINGSRIAKINRVPVKLSQPYFLHATITRKDVSVIISLLRIALGRPAAEYAMRNQLSFKLVTPVDAQIDGEVMHLPANTQITASSVRTELRFVSSKLK